LGKTSVLIISLPKRKQSHTKWSWSRSPS
jgi:hypothetical protein